MSTEMTKIHFYDARINSVRAGTMSVLSHYISNHQAKRSHSTVTTITKEILKDMEFNFGISLILCRLDNSK